ncbi:MAG TPA: hypothetical protein GXZ90_07370 [Clostridiales bacterium]|nr:hypothetical protein [Clostridiales bacterium]
MLFAYRGIDVNYEYKRGAAEANTELDAIRKIKEQENVLVIVSLKKVYNINALNKIRSNFNSHLVNIENKINQKTNEIIQKDKIKKDVNKKSEKKGELIEKSPILKGLNNLFSKIERNKRVIVDEDMYSNLQAMFKNMEDSESNYSNYELEINKDELSDNKIKKTKIAKDKEKYSENKIDWSLIDNEEDPSIKDNMKIKVKEREIIMFTRRLHIMLSSGVPLLSSLTLLQGTSSHKMSMVLNNIVNDIQSGNSLSTAMSKYPNQFNYTYVALISIGETSGSLEKSLEDIIKLKEQEQKIMRKVKVASIYPAVVGVVLVIMVLGISFFLPQFEAMFLEQSIEMPGFTTLVFGIANASPYIVGTLLFIIALFAFLKKRIPELNYLYRRYRDKLMLNAPVIKEVSNASYMHSFSSTIALMLDNGIRLSDTLSLTGKTINNIYIKNEIEDVSNLILHGLSFSDALGKQENFDEILVNIAMTGEESGQMVFSLNQVADYFETDLIRQVDSLMELVQPVSILLIAAIVAPVVIAAYLPILEMSSGAGIL